MLCSTAWTQEDETEPYLTLCGIQKRIRSFFHSFSSLNSVKVCSLLFTAFCLLPLSPSLVLANGNLHIPGGRNKLPVLLIYNSVEKHLAG